jgi:acyl carrier protein
MLEKAAVPLELNLKRLIFKELNIHHMAPEEFSNEEPIFGGALGLDSIDAVEIVYLVEKHFGVSIKDMKVARPALRSISTLAAFIETGAV